MKHLSISNVLLHINNSSRIRTSEQLNNRLSYPSLFPSDPLWRGIRCVPQEEFSLLPSDSVSQLSHHPSPSPVTWAEKELHSVLQSMNIEIYRNPTYLSPWCPGCWDVHLPLSFHREEWQLQLINQDLTMLLDPPFFSSKFLSIVPTGVSVRSGGWNTTVLHFYRISYRIQNGRDLRSWRDRSLTSSLHFD